MAFSDPLQNPGFSFGQTVDYKCNGNYTLDADVSGKSGFKLTCGADGHFSQPPSCQMITCPPAPAFDTAVPITSVPVELGRSLQYSCKTGYNERLRNGNSSPTFTIECLYDPLTLKPYFSKPSGGC